MKTWHRTFLLLVLALSALGFLVGIIYGDERINFLPSDGRARWIVFPTAIDTGTHPIVALDTRFQRDFDLASIPPTGRLLVRAAKQCGIRLNDVEVIPHVANWKRVSSVDVTGFLHAGPNNLEVRVFNKTGPPALWLLLEAGDTVIRTDESWKASFTGSIWRNAAPASIPRFPRPGNLAFGGETMKAALPKIWLAWLILAISGAVVLSAIFYFKRRQPNPGPTGRDLWPALTFVTICLLWIALFWNNTRHVPFVIGFDASLHLDYIDYIQKRHALPLPNEGFEMYQPPLYYAISAGVLSLFRMSTADQASVAVLRGLTMLFGLGHLLAIFLILRLVFAGRVAPQIVGLVLAASLPMQIYMSHYVTNETLCATLIAATIYVAVRLLRSPKWPLGGYAMLGFFLGGALLTKATAVLLIPLLLIALATKLVRQKANSAIWAQTVGLTAIVCLAICGWHYGRVAQHFGQPLVGNWDVSSGFAWWQDPGYRTPADYWRFGRVLIAPFFSGLNGFWDGIYGTLWGDGLWGGISNYPSRVPWNYDLVTGGYLLALWPTIFLLLGGSLALREYLLRPTSHWFLLFGWPVLLFSGIAFMTLKVPALGQVRAIYGLSSLISLSVLVALAWDRIIYKRPWLKFAFGLLLFLWATNSFASIWIRDSVALHLYRTTKFRDVKNGAAAKVEAERAVQLAPNDAIPHRYLSLVLADENRIEDAVAEARRSIELAPNDSAAHAQLGALLAMRERNNEAAAKASRALELGPENAVAYSVLLPALLDLERDADIIAGTGDAFSVVGFTPEAHYISGFALGREQKFSLAAEQFIYALLLRPGWEEARVKLSAAFIADTELSKKPFNVGAIRPLISDSPVILNDLAWLLATSPNDNVRNGEEAVRLSEEALKITGGSGNPTLLTTMAAAYAEAGKFPEATSTAEKAMEAARAAHNELMIRLSTALLDSFRAKQPYRQGF